MRTGIIRTLFPSLLVSLLAAVGTAQKKPLDPSVYDIWNSVRGTTISSDGKWIAYAITPQEGDATVEVKSTASDKDYSFARGTNLQFSGDSKFLVATVIPAFAETKKARVAKAKPEDMPKSSLLILNLDSGAKTEIPAVTSFSMAQQDKGWILYHPDTGKPAAPAGGSGQGRPLSGRAGGGRRGGGGAGGGGAATLPEPEQKPAEPAAAPDPKKPQKKSDHKPGETWVLRQLSTGKDEKIEFVVGSRFSKDGSELIYTLSTKDGLGDGIAVRDLAEGTKKMIVQGLGHYPRYAISEPTKRLAFVTDKDDYMAKKPLNSLYYYDPKTDKLTLAAKAGSVGLPKDWTVSDLGSVSFSDRGNRILFGTIPKPAEEKKDETPDEDKVSVDIWNWKDALLQPTQLLQANNERSKSYLAIYFLGSERILQVESPSLPNASVGAKGEADVALGETGLAYQREATWDGGHVDYYLIDLHTGDQRKVASKLDGNMSLSQTGAYAVGYDQAAKRYFSVNTGSGQVTEIAKDVPYPLYNELHDTPDNPNAYGLAGWTKGDSRVLIYDNFDVWAVDPTGKEPALCVTNSYGRRHNLRLRYITHDPDETYVPWDKPMVLTAFNETTKGNGFFVQKPGSKDNPSSILADDKTFSIVGKATNADVLVFTRQDFVEYPDLWVTSQAFENPRKISNANPQQANYNWGKAELINWTSNDGVKLKGILIRPEDFDYKKTYPMISYFYERSSDTLNRYPTPAPSASVINLAMYASNGYCIFIPDIPYKIGYPGQSAVSAIMPGVQEILRRGYIDPKRLGIQGQSWGGYQVAYMVTETDMFAAACSGAPVGDMFSAYGGIRYGSGIVREVQYEEGQSRIGGTPWNATLRYLENSPVFFADKVKTPLLIMSNDQDGAVPHTQGIELFTALRRLDKPSWLVVYNGEDHNIIQRKNRKDWSLRMQQFFDHYLKGAPEPVWMEKGVPAVQKGKTYGFEYKPGKQGG